MQGYYFPTCRCRCAYMCCLMNTWNCSLNPMSFTPLGQLTELTKYMQTETRLWKRAVFDQSQKLPKQESNFMWLMKSISRLHTSKALVYSLKAQLLLRTNKGGPHWLTPKALLDPYSLLNNNITCQSVSRENPTVQELESLQQTWLNSQEFGAGRLSLPPVLAGCCIAGHMVYVSPGNKGKIPKKKRILHLYL